MSAVHNSDIASILNELADLLEIEGANSFRVRAYRDAATTLERLPDRVGDQLANGDDLTDLPGIGENIAEKIEEIVNTGSLRQLHDVRQRVPPGLADLLAIEGLGPRRIQQLHAALGITTREELAEAARQNRIREVEGFGETMQANILEQIERTARDAKRMLLSDAEKVAEPLLDYLRAFETVQRAEVAGSYRRRKETVGDLDIVVLSTEGRRVADHLAKYEAVEDVISIGDTRARVWLRAGLAVDMRVVSEQHFGAALFYLTGSRDHNLTLRNMAIDSDLKLNEYGVFRGDEQIAGQTEPDVYAVFHLPCIPPELREDQGEIQAARSGKLPDLITLDDLRGNLHTHTTASDGRASLEDMVDAARARRFEYLAITDHSPHIGVTRGLSADDLLAQMDRIAALNDRYDDIRLLCGIEVDILEDGSLDMPDEVLAKLDIVICAIHSRLRLPRDEQTARVLRALDNPYVNILAHPTERFINKRLPIDLDLEQIIDAAAARGIALELNAQPFRLDLNDAACRMACERGALIAIGADVHDLADFDVLRYGVDQARRGWLEAEAVLNTRPYEELVRFLKR